MDVEIVFSGICSFVNVNNEDDSIIEPSVILLNANGTTLGSHGPAPGGGGTGAPAPAEGGGTPPAGDHAHGGGAGAHDQPADQPAAGTVIHDHDHIPYIAFDSRLVGGESEEEQEFSEVKNAPSFQFLRVEGVELQIKGHNIGVPVVDATFGNVVSREEYWPESQRLWNDDFVPRRGQQPKKTAVKVLMRFADGRISGGRLCPFKWKITKSNGDTFSRHFAEEVIYSYSDSEAESVVVRLLDLENPRNAENKEIVIERLTFRPKIGQSKVTLFIGNCIQADMDTAVRRKRSKKPGELKEVSETHFQFFDKIVDAGDLTPPPLPKAVLPNPSAGGTGSGGSDGGICGPKKG